MESLFFTLIVDTHEGCDVANFDTSGEYLHAEMPKEKRILLNIRGYFVAIMCQVNPEYEKHVGYENGRKVLYLLVLG